MTEPRLLSQGADEGVVSTDLSGLDPGYDRLVFTRLLAADESGLPSTFALGFGVVAAAFFTLQQVLAPDTWNYEFLFRRGFVQWVLLVTFTIGLIHMLRRIPVWRRERAALRDLRCRGTTEPGSTTVQRRWMRVRDIGSSENDRDCRIATKTLAEHDEAELDAAYRLPSDVVQVLPLMGFFGTVFGLSHGLYQSFLAAGGATTKDFAKAIAIAFDNTLLGLALTIILFIVLSLLRKREDSLLLQLNLFAESWLLEHSATVTAPPHRLSGAVEQIDRSLRQFDERMEADQTAAAEALERLAASVGAAEHSLTSYGEAVKLIAQFAAKVEEKTKDSARASTGIAQLGEAMTAVRNEVGAIKSSVASVQFDIKALDSSIGKVGARVGTTSGELATHVNTLHKKLDDVQKAAAGLPNAAREIGDQIVAVLRADLGAQEDRIRDEVRRPRRIQIVESAEGTEKPGDVGRK